MGEIQGRGLGRINNNKKKKKPKRNKKKKRKSGETGCLIPSLPLAVVVFFVEVLESFDWLKGFILSTAPPKARTAPSAGQSQQ